MDRESILEQLNARVDELHKAATRLAGAYWDAVQSPRRREDAGKPNLGLRVQKHKGSVSIYWCRAYFYGPKGDRKVGFATLPRGQGTCYRWASVQKHAAGWEKELFDYLEPMFGEIRHELGEIGRIKKTLGRIGRLERVSTWRKELGTELSSLPGEELGDGGDCEDLHEGISLPDGWRRGDPLPGKEKRGEGGQKRPVRHGRRRRTEGTFT